MLHRVALVVVCASVALGLAACGGPPRSVHGDVDEPAWTAEDARVEHQAAARAAYAKAVFMRERGDLEGAHALFLEAVRLGPGDPTARLGLAELLAETGRWRESLSFLESSVRRFRLSAPEYLLLARLQLLGKRPDRALAAADSAVARDAGLAEAWMLRGRILADARRLEPALACFQRADSLAPGDATNWEAIGLCWNGLGERDKAASAFERALELDPQQEMARSALAEIYRQLGKTRDAVELFLGDEGGEGEGLERAVEILVRDGALEEAVELLEPLHAEGDLPPRLAYVLGRVLLQLDRLAAADSVFAGLGTADGMRGIHALRGDIAARRERLDEARQHYRAAMAEDASDCTPFTSYILLEAQARRDEAGRVSLGEARQEFEAALGRAEENSGPGDFRCHVVLGHAYAVLKRHADAARHLEIAHELDPENIEILFSLAMAHQESGHFEPALRHSRAALALDPEHAATLNFVGYILAERGQELQESEALIRRALAKEPENGYYVDSLGWVLFQKGDYAGAVVELERASRLTGDADAVILEHLGDVYSKLGRLEKAYAAYEGSNRIEPANPGVSEKLAKLGASLGKP